MTNFQRPDLHARGGLLIGLIGAQIGGSFSPQLHETEAREQGFELHYRLLDANVRGFTAADLPRLLDAMCLVGFTGSNVTYPFKEAILPHLAGLSAEAAEIGAVNTIVLDPARGWIGHNTDCLGFAASFRRDLAGAATGRVVLLGAGGAGSAVANGMLREGAQELLIIDRDHAKSNDLAAKLCNVFGQGRARTAENLESVAGTFDGLINATPIGMQGKPGVPFDIDLLSDKFWVSDIIYFPRETEMLKSARLRGCRTMNGGGMVVFQAAEAFRIFTGISPDAGRMWRNFQLHTDNKA